MNSLAGAECVSVIFAWGKKSDGYSVEYRIANFHTDDERKRLVVLSASTCSRVDEFMQRCNGWSFFRERTDVQYLRTDAFGKIFQA